MRKSRQYRFEPEVRLEGYGQSFTDDARDAMQASPDYFTKWYTFKSLLLVGVTAALAYQLGKNSKR